MKIVECVYITTHGKKNLSPQCLNSFSLEKRKEKKKAQIHLQISVKLCYKTLRMSVVPSLLSRMFARILT